MRRFRVLVGACALGGLVASGVVAAPMAGAIVRGDDETIAAAGVLAEADFPAGWTSSASDSSGDAATVKAAKKIPSCKRYLELRALGKKQPRAESPEFELGASQVDNVVAVFPSVGAATDAMRAFDTPSVLTCVNRLFRDVFQTQLDSSATTRGQVSSIDVDITRSEVAPVADATSAYEGTVGLTMKDGSEQSIGIGTAAVRAGRALSIYSYVVDSSEVVSLLPALVDASAARLVTALA